MSFDANVTNSSASIYNDLCIVNGRLEEGKCTFHACLRNKPVSSLVDYVVTDIQGYNNISNMCVMDISEFSDHCPIAFTLQYDIVLQNDTARSYDTIIWNSDERANFCNMLTKVYLY